MRVLAALAVLLLSVSADAQQQASSEARTLAKEAYDTIKDHPFESQFIEGAAAKLGRAQKLDPNECYVWLAASALIKTLAYHSGDWTDRRSFDAQGLEKATELAKKAVDIDPSALDPHVELAWLYVIHRQFPEARHEYYVAHQLAPDAFEVWYGQAVCWWKQGDAQKSHAALEGAEQSATTKHQKRILLIHKERIAESHGDVQQLEAILKEHIRLDPDYPWAHGNYGGFLMEQGRYAESVMEYEKAIKLGSYPLAVEQLAEAKRLRDEAARPRK